jgi:RHS repeat-associated protein
MGGVSMSLNDMNGRVQDALTGRFLSADPYGDAPGDTQSYNRYSYVSNNPLSRIDPSGFENATLAYNSLDPIVVEGRKGPADPQSDMSGGADLTGSGGDVGSGSAGGGGSARGDKMDPIVVIGHKHPSPPSAFLPRLIYTLLNLDDSFSDAASDMAAQATTQATAQSPLPCSAANSSGNGVLIQLAFTNANSSGSAIPGANHTFVIAADPATGAVYASRGGPGSGPGGGPGIGPTTFVASSGPYNAGFIDYGSVSGVQTVGYVNAPFGQVTNYIDSFAATSNANNLTYLGPIQNSNSYSGSLLSGLGFQSVTPDLRAPGFSTNSPSPQLQCTKH